MAYNTLGPRLETAKPSLLIGNSQADCFSSSIKNKNKPALPIHIEVDQGPEIREYLSVNSAKIINWAFCNKEP